MSGITACKRLPFWLRRRSSLIENFLRHRQRLLTVALGIVNTCCSDSTTDSDGKQSFALNGEQWKDDTGTATQQNVSKRNWAVDSVVATSVKRKMQTVCGICTLPGKESKFMCNLCETSYYVNVNVKFVAGLLCTILERMLCKYGTLNICDLYYVTFMVILLNQYQISTWYCVFSSSSNCWTVVVLVFVKFRTLIDSKTAEVLLVFTT